MYNKFYGFRESPFKLTPDPRFLYLSENHKEALAHLKFGLQEKNGFVALTGEVGTGKTTLLYSLIGSLNGKVKTVFITNPKLSVSDFFHFVNSELRLDCSESKSSFLINFKKYVQNALSRNEIILLIIDEAQNLSFELLEEIRLLSNLETPSVKLLQVFLVGQQELNNKLNMDSQRQLKQRISIKYHIQPLNFKDTQKYIQKRIYLAGCKNRNLFTKKAIKHIYRYSRGIPRVINFLCDQALLAGYVKEKTCITHSIIKEIIKEREASFFILQEKGRPDKRSKSSIILLIMTFTLITMILFFCGWFFLM